MAIRFQSPQPPDQAPVSLPHFPSCPIPLTLFELFSRFSLSPLCFSSGAGGNVSMATDELHKPQVTLPQAPSINQYPEMIMATIDAINDPNGCNKSTMSKHMESTYGDLPAAHSTLLSHHLTKLKNSGQLVFVKNNYVKPDPNAPPKRGRGRPPKPKDPLAPISLPKKVSAGSGRPRGRPPKDKPEGVSAPPAGAPRGRGRPPKIKPAVAAVGC